MNRKRNQAFFLLRCDPSYPAPPPASVSTRSGPAFISSPLSQLRLQPTRRPRYRTRPRRRPSLPACLHLSPDCDGVLLFLLFLCFYLTSLPVTPSRPDSRSKRSLIRRLKAPLRLLGRQSLQFNLHKTFNIYMLRVYKISL